MADSTEHIDFTCSICLEEVQVPTDADADAHDTDLVSEQDREHHTDNEHDAATSPASAATVLPCKHVFHERCIAGWVSVHRSSSNTNSVTCPNCRNATSEGVIEEASRPLGWLDLILVPLVLAIWLPSVLFRWVLDTWQLLTLQNVGNLVGEALYLVSLVLGFLEEHLSALIDRINDCWLYIRCTFCSVVEWIDQSIADLDCAITALGDRIQRALEEFGEGLIAPFVAIGRYLAAKAELALEAIAHNSLWIYQSASNSLANAGVYLRAKIELVLQSIANALVAAYRYSTELIVSLVRSCMNNIVWPIVDTIRNTIRSTGAYLSAKIDLIIHSIANALVAAYRYSTELIVSLVRSCMFNVVRPVVDTIRNSIRSTRAYLSAKIDLIIQSIANALVAAYRYSTELIVSLVRSCMFNVVRPVVDTIRNSIRSTRAYLSAKINLIIQSIANALVAAYRYSTELAMSIARSFMSNVVWPVVDTIRSTRAYLSAKINLIIQSIANALIAAYRYSTELAMSVARSFMSNVVWPVLRTIESIGIYLEPKIIATLRGISFLMYSIYRSSADLFLCLMRAINYAYLTTARAIDSFLVAVWNCLTGCVVAARSLPARLLSQARSACAYLLPILNSAIESIVSVASSVCLFASGVLGSIRNVVVNAISAVIDTVLLPAFHGVVETVCRPLLAGALVAIREIKSVAVLIYGTLTRSVAAGWHSTMRVLAHVAGLVRTCCNWLGAQLMALGGAVARLLTRIFDMAFWAVMMAVFVSLLVMAWLKHEVAVPLLGCCTAALEKVYDYAVVVLTFVVDCMVAVYNAIAAPITSLVRSFLVWWAEPSTFWPLLFAKIRFYFQSALEPCRAAFQVAKATLASTRDAARAAWLASKARVQLVFHSIRAPIVAVAVTARDSAQAALARSRHVLGIIKAVAVARIQLVRAMVAESTRAIVARAKASWSASRQLATAIIEPMKARVREIIASMRSTLAETKIRINELKLYVRVLLQQLKLRAAQSIKDARVHMFELKQRLFSARSNTIRNN